MSGEAGETLWQADYAPFGKATVKVERVAFELRLPGQYHDRESGLHYNYRRHYDPASGRYLSPDPVGLSGGLDRYGYVGANPLGASDRLGLAEDEEPLTTVEEGETPFAFIRRHIGEAGQGAVDASLDALLGGEFETLAREVFAEVPNALGDLARDDPRYAGLDIDVLKPSFSPAAARDMAYTVALMVAIERGADWIIKKPTLWNVLGGTVVKHAVLGAIKGYLLYEFGSAGVAYFDTLRGLGERFVDLAEGGYGCADVEALADEVARSVADFALGKV